MSKEDQRKTVSESGIQSKLVTSKDVVSNTGLGLEVDRKSKDVATKDVATKVQSKLMASKDQPKDVAAKVQSKDVASKVQSKLMASKVQSKDVAAKVQSKDVASKDQPKDVASKDMMLSKNIVLKDSLQSKDMMLKDSLLTDNEVSSMPFERLLDDDIVDWTCPCCTLKNTTSLFACVCEACEYEEGRHRYSPTVSIDSHSNEISKVSTNSAAKRKQKRTKTHFDVSQYFPNLVIYHSFNHSYYICSYYICFSVIRPLCKKYILPIPTKQPRNSALQSTTLLVIWNRISH